MLFCKLWISLLVGFSRLTWDKRSTLQRPNFSDFRRECQCNMPRAIRRRAPRKYVLRCVVFSVVLYLYTLPRHPDAVKTAPLPVRSTVSMVVPATWRDFTCYIGHLIKTIKSFDSRPDEYIFVVSSWKERAKVRNVLAYLETELRSRVKLFTFEDAQNQARNRNIGAAHATKDIIFFFDMDDTPYPWSFTVIRNWFKERVTADGFIFSHAPLQEIPTHMFDDSIELDPFCRTSQIPCNLLRDHPSYSLFVSIFGGTRTGAQNYWCCRKGEHANLAPGWFSIERRKLLTSGMFDDSYKVGEDGDLIGRLLARNLNIEFTNVTIGYYNQQHLHPTCDDTSLERITQR